MQTSQQWWDEVKKDETKLNEWLVKQYRGEASAFERIMKMAGAYDMTHKAFRTLSVIASQEATHAGWVKNLLKDRGIDPLLEGAENRYWAEVKDAMEDFETTCAVGAHAEAMRLERINVIVADPDSPEDIREVFKKIQVEEQFHARAFAELAGEDAIARTKGQHDKGLAILGLVI
jgi:rubrerythrin